MSTHLANSPFDSAVIHNARDLFDIPREITYFNCANMAPQLRSVTAAGIHAVRERVSPWKLSAPDWFSGTERLRSLAAQVFWDWRRRYRNNSGGELRNRHSRFGSVSV